MLHLEHRLPAQGTFERLLQRCGNPTLEIVETVKELTTQELLSLLWNPKIRTSAVVLAIELLFYEAVKGGEIIATPNDPYIALEPAFKLLSMAEADPFELAPPLSSLLESIQPESDRYTHWHQPPFLHATQWGDAAQLLFNMIATTTDRDRMPSHFLPILPDPNLPDQEWWEMMGDGYTHLLGGSETIFQILFTLYSLKTESNNIQQQADRVYNAASVYAEIITKRAAFVDTTIGPDHFEQQFVYKHAYEAFRTIWWHLVTCRFSYQLL